jgi:predicted membrane protein
MVVFAILALFAFENKRKYEVILFISSAILFQPFKKIYLGRELWNIMDVLLAVYLFYSFFQVYNKKN